MLLTYLLLALKGLRCDAMRAQGEGEAGMEAEDVRRGHRTGWSNSE